MVSITHSMLGPSAWPEAWNGPFSAPGRPPTYSARLEELVEEMAGETKAGAEVEEESPVAGLDEDLVAADFTGVSIGPGGATMDGDDER